MSVTVDRNADVIASESLNEDFVVSKRECPV